MLNWNSFIDKLPFSYLLLQLMLEKEIWFIFLEKYYKVCVTKCTLIRSCEANRNQNVNIISSVLGEKTLIAFICFCQTSLRWITWEEISICSFYTYMPYIIDNLSTSKYCHSKQQHYMHEPAVMMSVELYI